MQNHISLLYNKEKLTVSIPSKKFLGFITPKNTHPLKDLPQSIHHALDHPIDSPPLDDFLRKGDRVVIIVSDITRYTGANFFLPHLIRRINKSGIPDKNISIVFALGIHRPMTLEEQINVVGQEIAHRIRFENHNVSDQSQFTNLGITNRGTPVVINRRAAEADKVILTGTIGFHYLAGFGGSRKSIIPGIASFEGCVANHLLVLDPDKGGRHSLARTGNLKGNPMHEDMMEACTFLPPTFLFNTILSPDYDILYLVAGSRETAFYEGCKFLKEHFMVPISRQADLVIVSCGGFPKDINLIQSHKTMEYAMNALRPGGVMLLMAACRDGIGHPDFLDWFRFKDPLEMESELRRNFQINGQTAYATLLKAKKTTILLLSEFPDSTVQSMSMIPVHSAKEALSKAYQLLGNNPSTYVIPYGSVTLPWIETSS